MRTLITSELINFEVALALTKPAINTPRLIFFLACLHRKDTHSLFCEVCREFSALAKENGFSSLPGCTSFKQESIEKHLKSAAHHACQASAAKRNPEKAPIVRAVAQMSEEMLGRMVSLFNTAYYVAIEEKPFSDFEALTTLQIKNGSQLGEQYTNRKASKNFISAIAKVVTDDLKTSLSKSPFMSLLMDSPCDVSVREHCNIFVRYVDSASQMACNKLLDVAFMHGTKAEHYMAAAEAHSIHSGAKS